MDMSMGIVMIYDDISLAFHGFLGLPWLLLTFFLGFFPMSRRRCLQRIGFGMSWISLSMGLLPSEMEVLMGFGLDSLGFKCLVNWNCSIWFFWGVTISCYGHLWTHFSHHFCNRQVDPFRSQKTGGDGGLLQAAHLLWGRGGSTHPNGNITRMMHLLWMHVEIMM